MNHPDAGTLRRLLDEPSNADADVTLHVGNCSECIALTNELRENAEFASATLGGSAGADLEAAHRRFERALYASAPAPRWYLPAGIAAAAVFALALVFTPLGTYARAFLTLFQPKDFVAIDLTPTDLQALHVAPQAGELGMMHVAVKQQRTEYSTIAAARDHLSFSPRTPSQLPASIPHTHSFVVASSSEYVYEFSASKARAFETRSHRALPPMPQSLDGTIVNVHMGQMLVARYGVSTRDSDERTRDGLVLIETPVPTVTSSGASFDELERYMLSLPGISPDLASQLRALGSLRNRVPVPVDTSKQNAQRVTVDGVPGLAIGDNTGLGAGVMWQKNGIVYGMMGGALTIDQVLALANGLH